MVAGCLLRKRARSRAGVWSADVASCAGARQGEQQGCGRAACGACATRSALPRAAAHACGPPPGLSPSCVSLLQCVLDDHNAWSELDFVYPEVSACAHPGLGGNGGAACCHSQAHVGVVNVVTCRACATISWLPAHEGLQRSVRAPRPALQSKPTSPAPHAAHTSQVRIGGYEYTGGEYEARKAVAVLAHEGYDSKVINNDVGEAVCIVLFVDPCTRLCFMFRRLEQRCRTLVGAADACMVSPGNASARLVRGSGRVQSTRWSPAGARRRLRPCGRRRHDCRRERALPVLCGALTGSLAPPAAAPPPSCHHRPHAYAL